MLASNVCAIAPDLFQGKSQTAQELYNLLLSELEMLGPVRVTRKEMSVYLENRTPFAVVIVRNRSIKLVLRASHKISNPRIGHVDRVANHAFHHTLFIESKRDIDAELLSWLADAYQANG